MKASPIRVKSNKIKLSSESLKLRKRIIEILKNSGRGHIGPAFSIIEMLLVIFGEIMDLNLLSRKDSKRDRFILSKGHGCLGLYVVLEKFNLIEGENLETFCEFNSPFGGHPESNTLPIIEFSTGSLGHGLPVAVGIAMASKLKGENYRVFVVVGDGELNEGSNWEAAIHAVKHKLDNLVVLVDYNEMQAYGEIHNVVDMNPLKQKWQSFGFETSEINGHDLRSIKKALTSFCVIDKPKCVISYTVKGKGLKQTENSSSWHHKTKITANEVQELLKGLSK